MTLLDKNYDLESRIEESEVRIEEEYAPSNLLISQVETSILQYPHTRGLWKGLSSTGILLQSLGQCS